MLRKGKNTFHIDCPCSYCSQIRKEKKKEKNKDNQYKKMRKEARILMAEFDFCADCGNKKEHVHHIVSLSEGGTNDLSNLKALCKECHHKYHKDLPSFMFK